MTTQKCPKCGSDKSVECIRWNESIIRACAHCASSWTDWQQSLIEQQQAEIEKWQGQCADLVNVVDHLRGVLTSIAENEEINTLRYKATLGQILPKVDQGKLAGLLFAAELARKGLGDK
jgi:hypothetical protein